MQSSFTYDDLNRVTALNAGKASYNYQLDATGNRKQVTESSGRVVNWSYDGIYRLTNETISLDPHSVNGSVGYGLDPVGNRQLQTSSIPGIGTGSFTYDPDDRLSTEIYDENGNTLTSGGKTFAYDFENRLKSMTAGSVTVTIQYDADGNRVARTVNGETTSYLVDDLNPTGYAQVVEEVAGAAAERTYTYGLQRISQNQQNSNAWTPSFYGYDAGGTVRLLTDATGTVTDTYDYDAWGNAVNTTGSTPNVYSFHGEYHDSDLGLYYLRARWYNPATGRLTSTDPEAGVVSDPVTLHRYLYARADPVNWSDPTGKAAQPQVQPGGAVSEYSLLVTIGANLVLLQQMIRADQQIRCIWEEANDALEIALLKLLLQEFPNMPLPPPPDPNQQLAGPSYAPNPKCARFKCAVRCQVIDFSQGYDNAVGYVTALGAGDTPKLACQDAEKGLNGAFNPRQPNHRVRHCGKKKQPIIWK